jgi:hypothetical protein
MSCIDGDMIFWNIVDVYIKFLTPQHKINDNDTNNKSDDKNVDISWSKFWMAVLMMLILVENSMYWWRFGSFEKWLMLTRWWKIGSGIACSGAAVTAGSADKNVSKEGGADGVANQEEEVESNSKSWVLYKLLMLILNVHVMCTKFYGQTQTIFRARELHARVRAVHVQKSSG